MSAAGSLEVASCWRHADGGCSRVKREEDEAILVTAPDQGLL